MKIIKLPTSESVEKLKDGLIVAHDNFINAEKQLAKANKDLNAFVIRQKKKKEKDEVAFEQQKQQALQELTSLKKRIKLYGDRVQKLKTTYKIAEMEFKRDSKSIGKGADAEKFVSGLNNANKNNDGKSNVR